MNTQQTVALSKMYSEWKDGKREEGVGVETYLDFDGLIDTGHRRRRRRERERERRDGGRNIF